MTLDKKLKKIGLDKNATIPYDILISTVGLIDTEIQNRYLISNGELFYIYLKEIKNIYYRSLHQLRILWV